MGKRYFYVSSSKLHFTVALYVHLFLKKKERKNWLLLIATDKEERDEFYNFSFSVIEYHILDSWILQEHG